MDSVTLKILQPLEATRLYTWHSPQALLSERGSDSQCDRAPSSLMLTADIDPAGPELAVALPGQSFDRLAIFSGYGKSKLTKLCYGVGAGLADFTVGQEH